MNNYLTEKIAEVYKERFDDDKAYLTVKLKELDQHESKYDALKFIATQMDSTGLRMLADKLRMPDSNGLRNIQQIWVYL
ncbi:hypothetical protein [Aliarcobacter skirrowii]|uniref:hypothetical protein n=1 Tax=Aliarcobacter skirrowii TaxID=28200 RepID=UPI00082957AD|nr:hypothetical protein [Aliarcobacter skirrowii]